MREGSVNSDADSKCWWEKTTALAEFEKEDVAEIGFISEGCYSQGPGKRMYDEGVVVGVAENRMDL